jgi:uncharacterized protein YjbI with pentapeptide repeats
MKNDNNSSKNYFYDAIRDPSIVFTFVLGIIVILTIIILDYTYKPGFTDVLVEAHGLVFDVIFFGLIIAIYDVVRRNKDRIKLKKFQDKQLEIRYLEEIDDYRGWYSDEAKFRIIGNIRRLNRLSIFNIDLEECYLVNCKLSLVKIESTTFALKYSYNELILDRSSFNATNFRSNLLGCKFILTEFTNSSFESLHIDNLNCSICDFSNSIFNRVSFSNSNFLSFNAKDLISIEEYEHWINDVKTNTYLGKKYLNQDNDSIQANIDFNNTKFISCQFRNITFERCFFQESIFLDCSFENTRFISCFIEGSNLKEYATKNEGLLTSE